MYANITQKIKEMYRQPPGSDARQYGVVCISGGSGKPGDIFLKREMRKTPLLNCTFSPISGSRSSEREGGGGHCANDGNFLEVVRPIRGEVLELGH